MLKKILGASLLGLFIAGHSLCSYGAEMVGKSLMMSGALKEYMAQYDDGVDGHESHFENRAEANLNFIVMHGNVMGLVQLETRDNDSTTQTFTYDKTSGSSTVTSRTTLSLPLFATQRWIQYKSGNLEARLGTIINVETLGYCLLGGLGTFAMYNIGATGNVTIDGGYAEADGVRLSYKIGSVKLGATLYGANAVYASQATDFYLYGSNPGRATQITASGKLGPVNFRAAVSSSTHDDYNDDSDDAVTDSYTHLGVQVPFGTMSVALDYASRTDDNGTSETDYADMGVMFSMSGIGPGSIDVTYVSQDVKDVKKVNDTNLVYTLPIGDMSQAKMFVLTRTTDPETGNSVTTQAAGAGFLTNF